MNLKHYSYLADDSLQEYVFFSEGPKGRIKKIVRYTKINEDPVVYNLGFGDEDKTTGDINDTIISNNNDRDIVLATVANTIIDFTNHYGNYSIVAEGSTPVRTRLYQMGISNMQEEIKKGFDIYGLKDGDWHKFEKNVNYDGFLIKRK